MGKGKKKKNPDFQKVKLKVGKKLKKPNDTDTAFKAKKVLLLEQLKHVSGSNQIVSRKKLNFEVNVMKNELCRHTRHYNANVRKDAVVGLKEIVCQQNSAQTKHDLKQFVVHLTSLVSDMDVDVRKLALSTLKTVFEKVTSVDVAPMFHLIVAHLICASTHLNSKIKMFSVKLLELLLDCLTDLCRGDWNLLKSYADLLNFREKSVDRSRKTMLLSGLYRILDVNYRKLDIKTNAAGETLDVSNTVNRKSCSLTAGTRIAPFDFPIVADLFCTKSSWDEIVDVKNLNYLLSRVVPFCHSFWIELSTSDTEGTTETTNLFDLDTLKIMMEILKIYILLLDQTKIVEESLDNGPEDNSSLTETFNKFFRNVSFLKRYANVFPCQVKRKNVVDVELSDICSTVNLLICEICSSSSTTSMIEKSRVESFLQRILRRKDNLLETKLSYAMKISSIYEVNLDVAV